MRVRRAWCSVCIIRYTILPVFVAPAKWYSYLQIERALLFITWPEFRSVTAGLMAWEIERQHRIENNLSPGPGTSTVRLWWKTLDRAELIRGITRISSGLSNSHNESFDAVAIMILPEDSWVGNLVVPVAQAPGPKAKPKALQPTRVLQGLRTLGKALLVHMTVTVGVSLLAIGAWHFDSTTGRRCMALPDLVGRVMPCRSPRPAAKMAHQNAYPPETSQPP